MYDSNICMYVCMYIYIYICTCRDVQSFIWIRDSDIKNMVSLRQILEACSVQWQLSRVISTQPAACYPLVMSKWLLKPWL